ncbi:undecaprenyl-diphosphatase [Enemella dayhoffiae]|uniref:Undecaprenyl-diphosphatase n=1 Tax=Enemella dayhoffiae TaxID=2016507 RepID=A0A255H649_9ACTN|nr:undecaprenyl-diphosphate phosphatase [Enemella dayhoffiae]OYO22144.1 undecaprenyl-diphosphatase [Enemella dayhoffiae]
MDWLDAIVLGIVQGLTEFLPISSSAHLSIVGQLLGGVDPGAAFTAITQLGTETAVVIYFARDIGRIIKQWALALAGRVPRNDPGARMGWLIIVGSIPIGVLGVLFEKAIDHNLRNLWITVAMLAGFAIVIAIADRVARNEKTLDQLSWRDGLLYGLFQAMALIPGVSRSGGTIAGGLLMGYRREAAARYSFLLAIPAVFLSGLYKLKDVAGDPTASWGPIIVATILAFGIGLAVIHWLLRFVSKHNFTVFVVYRLMLAAVVSVLLLTGVLHPLAQG